MPRKKSKDNIDNDIETVINMTNRNGRRVERQNINAAKKENEKKQRKSRRTKRIIKWVSIIAIVAAAIIFALTSPLFNINEIKIENNNFLSEEKIISLSGLNKGQNIFRFLESDVEKHLKEDSYVESAKIERQLPNTVKIDVKERNRDFCIKFLNGFAYINNQGYILEIVEENNGVTIIEGIETPEEEIQQGARLNNTDLKKLEVAIQIMTIAKENEINSKITSIDISNKNEYILYLAEEKKTAYLGNSNNLTTKILYIKEIMEKYEVGKEGSIYVNGDFSKNFKPYFREKV